MKAISTTRRQLSLFVIVEGKKWKDEWYTEEIGRKDQISISENGRTSNKLFIDWMQECYKLAIAS